MEYFEDNGGAEAHLEWSSNNQERQVVPQSQLYAASVVTGANKGIYSSDILVYPNPSNTQLNIHTGSESITNYVISDLHGKEMLYDNTSFIGIKTIDISALHAGVYLLQLTENGHTTTQKIIVE